jgi:hypothetical protein
MPQRLNTSLGVGVWQIVLHIGFVPEEINSAFSNSDPPNDMLPPYANDHLRSLP